MPVIAHPAHDGRFWLYGDTYSYRAILKQRGAVWHPEKKAWLATRPQAEKIAIFMVWAHVGPHCHMAAQDMWITESEYNSGMTARLGCSMCDTNYGSGESAEVLGPGISRKTE